jgi:peroxiredoxin
MVTVGGKAPDFIAPALVDGEGVMVELFKTIRTHDAVALLFAPADFVPECTAELVAVRDAGWHTVDGLAVIFLSGDSLFSHAAYADQHDLPFTLVSDFHGSVAETYGLLAEEWEGHSHIPRRATVVVDGDWDVAAIHRTDDPLDRVSPAPVEDASETLRSLGLDVQQPNVDYART